MQFIDISQNKIEALLKEHFQLVVANVDISKMIDTLFGQLNMKSGDKTKVVSFIGGAASGKTSIVKNIVSSAGERELRAGSFSTDDFLIGDRAYRRENFEGKAPS